MRLEWWSVKHIRILLHQSFEGVPAPYDTQKRQVIPDALRIMRLKTHRNFCQLGQLATEVGWKHQSLVGRLEARRKVLRVAST